MNDPEEEAAAAAVNGEITDSFVAVLKLPRTTLTEPVYANLKILCLELSRTNIYELTSIRKTCSHTPVTNTQPQACTLLRPLHHS